MTASTELPAPDTAPVVVVGSGGRRRRLRGIRDIVRASRTIQVGLLIVLTLFALGVFAPFLTPWSPTQIDLKNTLRMPSAAHLLGTDELGRDQFTRLLYGARVSMVMGLIAVFISASVGAVIGLVAGYFVGFFDDAIMRVMDAILAFPALLLALLVVSVVGPGLVQVLIAFGIAGIPFYARLMRGMVLSIRAREYVEAAEALGASPFKIIFWHILPNAMAPLIITTTLAMGLVIVGLASLGFIGLGAQPPTPEWGSMLSGNQSRFFSAPWLLISPGLAIVLAVVGYSLVGDGLRDALDPRLRYLRG
ncbi:MAG: ABC transporter permease [Chloroflexi bacterium]|nr:ABC transporter permease [Chloroflexota bacterium]